MSKSGKHGATWSDAAGRYVNSRAFTNRFTASKRKAKAARKSRRANRGKG